MGFSSAHNPGNNYRVHEAGMDATPRTVSCFIQRYGRRGKCVHIEKQGKNGEREEVTIRHLNRKGKKGLQNPFLFSFPCCSASPHPRPSHSSQCSQILAIQLQCTLPQGTKGTARHCSLKRYFTVLDLLPNSNFCKFTQKNKHTS